MRPLGRAVEVAKTVSVFKLDGDGTVPVAANDAPATLAIRSAAPAVPGTGARRAAAAGGGWEAFWYEKVLP